MSNRLLKIGTRTDRVRDLTYAELTLAGRWLVAAGFKPGDYVRVEMPEPGVIVLKRTTTQKTKAEK